MISAATELDPEAGVAANLGKTRVYHARGGPAPPGIHELGETMQDMLGGREADAEAAQHQARDIAFLPASLGGLGLLHAERISPAAYGAAWADALPVLQQRCPEAVERCLQELEAGNQAAAPSLQAAAVVREAIGQEGRVVPFTGWARRWWGALAVAVQRAACSAVFGVWTMPPLPAADDVPLAEVLQYAADTAPSRLPLR
ncbi:unnamed protein product [Symbiodinium natans]|uniref:Uncharacterized protein n=1 Tax=Symbiodinium natans TaxID=878477 RepID=A0A812UYL5_9DINO|nr:unnamed protein product [Symbiodinium natans]